MSPVFSVLSPSEKQQSVDLSVTNNETSQSCPFTRFSIRPKRFRQIIPSSSKGIELNMKKKNTLWNYDYLSNIDYMINNFIVNKSDSVTRTMPQCHENLWMDSNRKIKYSLNCILIWLYETFNSVNAVIFLDRSN